MIMQRTQPEDEESGPATSIEPISAGVLDEPSTAGNHSVRQEWRPRWELYHEGYPCFRVPK